MNCLTSMCRSCRYYQPQGRRGGQCEMLGVSVQSHWKACHLAASPFVVSWEESQKIGIEALYQELQSERIQQPEKRSDETVKKVSKSSPALMTV